VRRENLQRNVTVTARLEGVDLGSGVASAQRAIADLHLPPTIRVEYGGAYQEQQQSFHDLVIVLILAVLLVFTVLLFEFGDFAAPIAVIASALLSTIGVFVALFVTRTTFNLSSFMGLIMVIGIARREHDSSRRAPAAADHDDGAGDGGRHDPARARLGRRLTDAPAARDRGDRWDSRVDGAVAGHHASGALLPGRLGASS
jgi:hypothetical protein